MTDLAVDAFGSLRRMGMGPATLVGGRPSVYRSDDDFGHGERAHDELERVETDVRRRSFS